MKTVPLTQGKFALVDDADFEKVIAFKWCAMKVRRGFYAVRGIRTANGKKKLQLMHSFLLPGVTQIDHKNGNGLDNQRHNIRPATDQQNRQGFRQPKIGGTSLYRGVSLERRRLKWVARIHVESRDKFLGYFEEEKAAAEAYDLAARKYFGEFACPNFP